VFAIHFHQPTGQVEWVQKRVYENSYRLLLDIMKQYADLKFTIHISGPLLLYLNEYYPEWISEMAKLGDYGTIEFLAGSFGEAILPLLPIEDRYRQIREYIKFFEKIFGYRPKGLWLPERVWEPSLPDPLARNGIEYVLVDDSTLHRAGRASDDAYYTWITEEGGNIVKVFFIDTALRYILPWRSSDEVINYMLNKGDNIGNRVIVWGSDAEKFGEWKDPGWARWWLNDFLSTLRSRRSDVRIIHPTEYLREYGVRGLIYLPTGSYDKMLEWSNGFFRNFLIKYAESNNMHKKMLWVRRKLREAHDLPEKAWRSYYLAQCNDAYWHGLFGGIYLSHLRQAIYENYIRAERIAEEYMNYYARKPLHIHHVDFDYDGIKEYLFETRKINLYFKPSDGGTLFEFDVKVKDLEHNVQDTMTRYWEAYLENTGFKPDWYRRVSLRIHLWSPDTNIWDWINNTPFKDQSDLALRNYHASLSYDNKLLMRSIGAHYLYGVEPAPIVAEKNIEILDEGLITNYKLTNHGNREVHVKIGLEYHVAPKIDRIGKGMPMGYYIGGEFHDINESWTGGEDRIIVKSPEYPDIILESSGTEELWVSPLYSLARTERGLQNIFQGLAIMFVKEARLKPGDVFSSNVKFYVSPI
jgi:alpha-amylase/alpha-mannosidase (GH57 family)